MPTDRRVLLVAGVCVLVAVTYIVYFLLASRNRWVLVGGDMMLALATVAIFFYLRSGMSFGRQSPLAAGAIVVALIAAAASALIFGDDRIVFWYERGLSTLATLGVLVYAWVFGRP